MGKDAESVIDLSDIKTVVNTYVAAVGEVARWTKIKDDLGKTLKAVMGNADVAHVDKVPALKITRRVARRFDTARFRDDAPDMYDAYIVESEQVALYVVVKDD